MSHSNNFFATLFFLPGKPKCLQAGIAEGDTCSLDNNNADEDSAMPALKVESCQEGIEVCEVLAGGYETIAQWGTVTVKNDQNSHCGTKNGQSSSAQACAAQTVSTELTTIVPPCLQGDGIPPSTGMLTWSRRDDGFHICDMCGYLAKKPYCQVLHSRVHTGERPFPCDLCPNSFTQYANLARHRRTHTGERPHACTVCQARFGSTSDLDRHRLVHTGERPYQCSFCSLSFGHRRSLTIHTRTHTGERPYKCDICNKRFIDNSNWRRHICIHPE